ncbi:hypothetical protein BDN70DRAFT_911604 [Pholiota conissans]|uniref:Uncharacterized protein n=1 Tax=Pholiota conissans TaxID=109636 RepID=A0A9P5Z7Q0_9AGAR|nr:hypothetical protein BDN70DRAFT_911604 [Pholiota conissans]
MPPQPGLFAVPSGTRPTGTSSAGIIAGPPMGPGIGSALGHGLLGAKVVVRAEQAAYEREQEREVGRLSQQREGEAGPLYGQIGRGHGAAHVNAHAHQSQTPLPPYTHPSAHPRTLASQQPPSRTTNPTVMPPSGSSRHGGQMDEIRKEGRRREKPSKAGKDLGDRRDDGRHFAETVSSLHNTAHILSTRPELSPLYRLRLYPITLERSALLAQYEVEERYTLECARVAYEEERERVEEEWRRGRERVRERLLEGIEERRRRAREEKEGDGTLGDAVLDIHSRPPTRKLRNKVGTSPPPTPHSGPAGVGYPITATNGTLSSNLPITTGPFPNPHSLSVDDLPSPFPLPLTATTTGAHASGAAGGAAGGLGGGAGGTAPNGSRRRVKNGANQGQAVGGLGKSLYLFTSTTRDPEADNDMIEIRRGGKRRRAVANAALARTGM